ncbi:MAG: D-glycerate dehydrogenase [Actinomycetes bacterium]
MTDPQSQMVFVTRALPEPGIGPLQAVGFTVDHRNVDAAATRSELLTGVADADGLLCQVTDRIDAEVLEGASRLRIIANHGVGYDNIDVAAAAERGIVVTNTPGVLTEATADLAWALILGVARRVSEGDRMVRSGSWTAFSPLLLLGKPLAGQTLGIVGMGAIGTAVARRARGFGMSVQYSSPSPKPKAETETGAKRVTLEALLATSDVVSLHAPLRPDTRHLIDAVALSTMKSDAILINTSRGALVDEVALVTALRAGTIGAAGLDVYEHEPTLTPGLVELNQTLLLPHIGSATTQTRGAMAQLCCDNIIEVLAGRSPITPVA